jgi:hypothetical protein
VGGVGDAGLFLPVKDWRGGPGYVRLWRRAADMQQALLPPACVADQGAPPPPLPPGPRFGRVDMKRPERDVGMKRPERDVGMKRPERDVGMPCGIAWPARDRSVCGPARAAGRAERSTPEREKDGK